MRILILSIIMVIGTASDVASTLYAVLSHGDRFMEANQFVQPEDLGFFLAVNALFLLFCFVPVLRTYHQSNEVFGRLRKTPLVDWILSTYGKKENLPLDSDDADETYMDYLKSADFTVSLLAVACAASLMRASAFINNLMGFYLGQGFAGAIFGLFPFIPLSVSVHLLAGLTLILCIPLGYVIVRRVALIGSHESDESGS